MNDFEKRLRALGLQKELSQLQLAEKLGLTKSTISAYENGQRMPSYEVLIGIANFFSVTTDYLLGQDQKDCLDLSGLTENEKYALFALVRAMTDKE